MKEVIEEKETLDIDLSVAMDLMVAAAVALSEQVVGESAPDTVEEFGAEIGRNFSSLLFDIVSNKQFTVDHVLGLGAASLLMLSLGGEEEEDGEA